MTDPAWLARIDRRVGRWGRGAAWVVAVSGGSDSVGLLRVLHRLAPKHGLTLSVAHLDHNARGDAGRADAAFVAELARSLALPFDLGSWSAVRTAHFEADARRARYEWLAETARRRGASAVATGHTRDDQAETVLHRIIRGTGPRGLAGIPPRRSLGPGLRLVRPLLDVSRAEIHAYLAILNQPYRDDLTNADTTHTRARLRHDLLPRIAADYNPRVVDALARLARTSRVTQTALNRLTTGFLRDAELPGDDGVALSRAVLATLPAGQCVEVIRRAWRRAGWPESGMTAARWRRLSASALTGAPSKFDAGAGVRAEVSEIGFVLRRAGPTPEKSEPLPGVPFGVPGFADYLGRRVVVTGELEIGCVEIVDADCLALPLSVRAPQPGDRFDPLGMDGRTQSLNDFFRGRDVAPSARPAIPLLCDVSGIVWVVGHRLADRVKVRETTRRRFGLRWEPV